MKNPEVKRQIREVYSEYYKLDNIRRGVSIYINGEFKRFTEEEIQEAEQKRAELQRQLNELRIIDERDNMQTTRVEQSKYKEVYKCFNIDTSLTDDELIDEVDLNNFGGEVYGRNNETKEATVVIYID